MPSGLHVLIKNYFAKSDLSNNRLSGQISPKIGNLKQLTKL